MKKLTFLFSLLIVSIQAQEHITIEQCYQLAKENYPLIKRTELIKKTEEYNVKNAAKGWLPQINISGQISYQSDVTELGIKIPGIEVQTLSKDQYKIITDINQTIYDGGSINHQKEISKNQSEIENQKNEVELDKLKERINQLFFGILQTKEQIQQTKLTQNDIKNGLKKAEAQLKNGIIFKSDVDVLKAQLVNLEQKQIELENVKENYLNILSLFIAQKLNDEIILEKPEKLLLSNDNKRSELKLFDLQKQGLDLQKKLITAKNLPKIGAFMQFGYGKPGLNMLKNEFDIFYIGGLKLNIPISGFYTKKNETAIIENQKKDLEIQRENFLFNQNIQTIQNDNELNKIQELIEKDKQLVILRESIRKACFAQLENGVANTNDYLREVNAEEQAKLQKIQHEIQYLLIQYNQKATYNN